MVVYKEFPTDITSKATPVDADILLIADSADGNEMKKVTVGSMTGAIADGVINDSASSTTTTYSSTKILALDAVQDGVISGLATSKLTRNGQLRTGNGAWKTTYNDASGNEVELSLGAATRVLTSGGASAAPTWEVPTTDIVSLTEDTSGDMDADFLLAYDNSATANRKQKANVYRASSAEALAKTANTKFMTPLGASGILDIAHTNVTVTNTSSETTLYTFSVPGGILSTNRGIRLRMFLSLKKATTAPSFSLKFKYGATTLVTTQINDATIFSTAKKGWVEFVLLSTGATGTQEGSVVFNLVTDNTPANSAVESYSNATLGTSSIDSTSAQNIAVTVQFGGTSTSDEAIAYHTILEKI